MAAAGHGRIDHVEIMINHDENYEYPGKSMLYIGPFSLFDLFIMLE